MKSIRYFLAAFVVSAMFASCAKEEMTVAPENDITGAELLGTNISVNFTKGVNTKMTADYLWEDTDKLGLGWLSSNSTTPTANLQANHLFQKGGEDGALVTKGNVYKGWHFGYYPFKYMDDQNQPLVVNLNPKQTQTGDAERLSSSLWLSARAYLTREADLDENLQLKTKFSMFQVSKAIVLNVTPASNLASDATLKELAITGIEIKTPGAAIFAGNNTVTVNPSFLSEMKNDEDGEYSESLTRKAFYKELDAKSTDIDKVLNWTPVTETAVVVDSDDINLSKAQALRVNVLPRCEGVNIKGHFTNTTDPANVTAIIVNVEGGKFVIKYVDKDEDELKSYESTNNQAFVKLAKAFEANGLMSSFEPNDKGEHREGVSLVLALDKKLFVPDFTSISSAKEWNQAVKIANALEVQLGGDTYPFIVDGTVVVDSDEALMIPSKGFANNSIKTSGNGVIFIDSEYNMPATLHAKFDAAAKIEVNSGATLNVPESKLIKANVINNGTINISKKANVGPIDNTNGRINVVYGSYLTIAGGYDVNNKKAGVIAYEATGSDDPEHIQNLMASTNTAGQAWINTFVVNEGVVLDLSVKVGVSTDEYNPNSGKDLDEKLLAKMDVLMYGGQLKAKGGANKTVKNIEVLAGENKLTDINAKKLFVKAGKLIVDATPSSIGIQNDIIISDEVINHSELQAEADIYTAKFTNPKGAKTIVNDKAVVWYTSTLIQNGTVEGTIEKAASSSKTVTVTKGSALASAITGGSKTIKLASDIKIESAKIGLIDLTGVTFDGRGYSVSTNNPVANGASKGVFNVKGAATIKNVVFDAPKANYDIVLSGGAAANKVVIENCSFTTGTDSAMERGKRGIFVTDYKGTVEVSNCTFDDKVYAFNSMSSDATFAFTNCNLNGWMSGEGKGYTFKYCTFGQSGDYADFIPYAPSTFEGCTFKTGFAISLRNATTLNFDASNMYGAKYVATVNDIKWSGNGGNGDAFAAKDVTVTIGSSSPVTIEAKQTTDNGSSFTWKIK